MPHLNKVGDVSRKRRLIGLEPKLRWYARYRAMRFASSDFGKHHHRNPEGRKAALPGPDDGPKKYPTPPLTACNVVLSVGEIIGPKDNKHNNGHPRHDIYLHGTFVLVVVAVVADPKQVSIPANRGKFYASAEINKAENGADLLLAGIVGRDDHADQPSRIARTSYNPGGWFLFDVYGDDAVTPSEVSKANLTTPTRPT